MSRSRMMAPVVALVLAGSFAAGTSVLGQGKGGKKPGGSTTEGAAAGTFRDDPGDAVASDDWGPYLGGNLNGVGGLGPECSRVSVNRQGDLYLRTVSSKCDFNNYTGPFRAAMLDFSRGLDDFCLDEFLTISKTVDNDTRYLHFCDGPQMVDDVQITVSAAGAAEIWLSLHAPPLSNQMQFYIDFEEPLDVEFNPDGDTWTMTADCDSGSCSAVLYDVVRNPKNGRITTQSVGRFELPFSLTARACGEGEDPC